MWWNNNKKEIKHIDEVFVFNGCPKNDIQWYKNTYIIEYMMW